MARSALPTVAVLGAGPIGLEAALQARLAGYPVVIYERGDVAEALNHWGHVRLFTPFGMNVSQAGLDLVRKEHPQHQLPNANDLVTGSALRDAYLVPLTVSALLGECLRTRTIVVSIGRAGVLKSDPANDPKRTTPFRLLLRDDKGGERVEEAAIVLDCTGSYGRHAWLGDGGIPAIGEIAAEKTIAYGVEDILGKRKQVYAGKSTIVIGGGYSAATAVCALAQVAEENAATWTIWLTRGPRPTPLTRNPGDLLRERERLAAKANNFATRGDGNVEHHCMTVIDEITSHGPDKGFRVVGRCNGKPMTWEVDRVIGNIGYVPDTALTRELHMTDFRDGVVKQPEPNYFVLGMKSYGRDSNFLLKRGYEQVKEVLTLLGKR